MLSYPQDFNLKSKVQTGDIDLETGVEQEALRLAALSSRRPLCDSPAALQGSFANSPASPTPVKFFQAA
jgi:hypothetical protein